ncbi:kinase-like domain-containing protein [Gigaspora rosea]|uniref:Kinase-like domain-containing protein n=1 Tax=Gigaspora rosea TaxID=44941 RepID=A0A397VVH5_9GLOM|nr:kinase-like domain-containing protein [Gigaspora rosea]
MAREPHFASIIMGDETPHKYSVKLIEFLHANNVRKFDYSQFSQLRYIQKGQSAMVYSATFENKVYALKCLNNNLLMDQETLKHLTREVTNLYNINHPNVIKLYGVSINISNFLLVLQFADKTLREYLKSKRIENLYQISWDELINLAKGITNGINYLHEKKIIHRDLHSNNILINEGKALIADFGLSKQIINNEVSDSIMQCSVAYTDPQYLSSSGGFERNEKSDIYSLGILLWELTSGISPFEGLNVFNIVHKIIINNERPETVPDTPSGYIDLIKKCWSSNQKDRPTTGFILNQLEKLSTESINTITNRIVIRSKKQY